ncbi:MAG: BMC domain-containing protein [Deltaproteobacteria bacterium]|nr:MAG: BMC domain-containing protein [Deltaproteobacteria bacterium]
MGGETTQTAAAHGPAVAMLDLAAIPPGLAALDALVKEALVEVISAGTVQAGRYLILFAGDVEPVERALARALGVSGGALLDSVLLPYAEPRIVPAVTTGQVRWPAPGDTLGVIQTVTTPTLLAAVDAALKGAYVELVELRVAEGLGGQGIASVWGEVYDVEAAIELAERAIHQGRSEGMWTSIIRNADPEVARALSSTTRFYKEWRG